MTDDPTPTSTNGQQGWPDRDLDLLFSGGGFRATLFHLGVVRLLFERKLLGRVRRVFSISGGSIFAAFLALNWNRFKAEESFDQAAQEVIAYCRSDVRGRLVRRYLAYVLGWCAAFATIVSILVFRGSMGAAAFYGGLAVAIAVVVVMLRRFRACWLVAMFQRDLARRLQSSARTRERSKPALLKDLPSPGDGMPDFHILVTDLTTGVPWAFTRRGVISVETLLSHETYPLSSAVAASAAFPALFSPVQFPKSIKVESLRQDRFLADGGIFDNLGIAFASANQDPDSPHDLIVCDAERRFEGCTDGTYAWLVSRTARVTDIMMNRISSSSWGAQRLTPIRLGDDAADADAAYPESSQRLARAIRTDLDHFTAVECQLLVAEGYLTASGVIDADPRPKPSDVFRFSHDGMPLEPCNGSHWLPFSEDQLETTVVTNGLRDSHRNRVGLFSKRDLAGGLLLIAAIAGLVLANPLGVYGLAMAWQRLPASPSAPTETWYASEQEQLPSPVDHIRSHLWSAIQPPAGVDASCGVFVSEPLSASYGWWPHGSFQLELMVQEPFHVDTVTAYFVDPSGRLMLVVPSGTERRRFLIDVPAGSSQERLCLALRAVPDQGSSPQNFKMKSLVQIRVATPSKESKR